MDPPELEAHTAKMRLAAREAYASRVAFDSLKSERHREVLMRALTNVLSTELALFTYAQIIDGLPIADVAWDQRYHGLFPDHISLMIMKRSVQVPWTRPVSSTTIGMRQY